MVIAANTGISASIDASGRILAEGPSRHEDTILADVRLDRRESWYLLHGDWFAGFAWRRRSFSPVRALWPSSDVELSGGLDRNLANC